jgi:uncharacterized protein (TIGR00369 family)
MSMGCALLDGLSHRSYDVGDDHVVELEISPDIRGPSGAVHGGLIASLVDRAGAYAAHAASSRTVATSTLSLSFLAAATQGPLRAVATNLRIGRQQGVVEVRVHDAGRDDVLVATALITLSFLRAQRTGDASGQDGQNGGDGVDGQNGRGGRNGGDGGTSGGTRTTAARRGRTAEVGGRGDLPPADVPDAVDARDGDA